MKRSAAAQRFAFARLNLVAEPGGAAALAAALAGKVPVDEDNRHHGDRRQYRCGKLCGDAARIAVETVIRATRARPRGDRGS